MEIWQAYLLILSLCCLVGFVSWILWRIYDRFHVKRLLNTPLMCTMNFSVGDIRIDPMSSGGIVRMSASLARSSGAAGKEAVMYRYGSCWLFPHKGFGEKRALPILISPDQSIEGRVLVMGAEDARTLRMGEGAESICLKFKSPHPRVREFRVVNE